MTVWWEIFADESGELIIERHFTGWRFDPTRNPGRPSRIPEPREMPPASIHDVLPDGVTLDGWKVSA